MKSTWQALELWTWKLRLNLRKIYKLFKQASTQSLEKIQTTAVSNPLLVLCLTVNFTSLVFLAADEECEEPPGSDLFCPACNKMFKTANA